MNAHRIAKLTLVLSATAVLATACGTSQSPLAANRTGIVSEAQATKSLLDGFDNVYAAAFQKLDANGDGSIDEYEAGPFIDLRELVKADANHDGKLNAQEFKTYGTREGLFGWCHATKTEFVREQRNQMLRAFNRLDANHDRLLSTGELAGPALAAQKVTLDLPGLKTKVVLDSFDDVEFRAADHTGDGMLGQAEFEDYALALYIQKLNPKFTPNPAPVPSTF